MWEVDIDKSLQAKEEVKEKGGDQLFDDIGDDFYDDFVLVERQKQEQV
jgi:hypothetical protein